jgi:hypothetical protein
MQISGRISGHACAHASHACTQRTHAATTTTEAKIGEYNIGTAEYLKAYHIRFGMVETLLERIQDEQGAATATLMQVAVAAAAAGAGAG